MDTQREHNVKTQKGPSEATRSWKRPGEGPSQAHPVSGSNLGVCCSRSLDTSTGAASGCDTASPWRVVCRASQAPVRLHSPPQRPRGATQGPSGTSSRKSLFQTHCGQGVRLLLTAQPTGAGAGPRARASVLTPLRPPGARPHWR